MTSEVGKNPEFRKNPMPDKRQKRKLKSGFILLQAYKKLSLFITILAKKK